MKQLEITTNKRLLIVELPNNDCEYGGLLKNRNLYFFTEKMSSEEDYPVCYPLPYDCEFICKGSDLTEDIAKGFTHNINFEQMKILTLVIIMLLKIIIGVNLLYKPSFLP